MNTGPGQNTAWACGVKGIFVTYILNQPWQPSNCDKDKIQISSGVNGGILHPTKKMAQH